MYCLGWHLDDTSPKMSTERGKFPRLHKRSLAHLQVDLLRPFIGIPWYSNSIPVATRRCRWNVVQPLQTGGGYEADVTGSCIGVGSEAR